MTLATYRCLSAHPVNVASGRGCGRMFECKAGQHVCPFCGAKYVERVK